jgi:hypothetical protein
MRGHGVTATEAAAAAAADERASLFSLTKLMMNEMRNTPFLSG